MTFEVLEVLKSSRFSDMETVQQALEWMLTVQPLQVRNGRASSGGWEEQKVFHGFLVEFYMGRFMKIAMFTFQLVNLSGNHQLGCTRSCFSFSKMEYLDSTVTFATFEWSEQMSCSKRRLRTRHGFTSAIFCGSFYL